LEEIYKAKTEFECRYGVPKSGSVEGSCSTQPSGTIPLTGPLCNLIESSKGGVDKGV